MVTAASTADLAIILIDARKGVLEQTKRHSYIANMVGIKNIIVAVNKMDLIDFSQSKFEKIVQSYKEEVSRFLDFQDVKFLPISALNGDNIVKKSNEMRWYRDLPIMQLLENIDIKENNTNKFAMPIQYVSRPHLDFRGFCGTVSSGKLALGEEVSVARSDEKAKIVKLYIGDKEATSCSKGDSITLTLDKEIDISRGDVLTNDPSFIEKENLFNSTLIWFDSVKCNTNRYYLLKLGTKIINAKVLKFKNKLDINTYKKINANNLEMNEIAEIELTLDENIAFKDYKSVNALGSFILIDKLTNLTVGAGVINHALRRSSNVIWEKTDIRRKDRSSLLGFNSKVLWFTGLSGSGKSTLTNLLEKKLHKEGILTYILDGDNLRHGLNRDLGFNEDDRIENLRRVGEVAKLMHDSGIFVLASFISPYLSDRENIRQLFDKDNFIEVYVKCDLETLKKRDPKGLYKKALAGEIPNFTGVSSKYEEPIHPEIIIDTAKTQSDAGVEYIIDYLNKNGLL